MADGAALNLHPQHMPYTFDLETVQHRELEGVPLRQRFVVDSWEALDRLEESRSLVKIVKGPRKREVVSRPRAYGNKQRLGVLYGAQSPGGVAL